MDVNSTSGSLSFYLVNSTSFFIHAVILKSTMSANRGSEGGGRETDRREDRRSWLHTSSSPGYGRKRRNSSLLLTRTSAVGLAELAGVGLLEGHVGLRWRKVRHGMEGEPTLPLILCLVVVRVLEAVAHRRRRGRSASSAGPGPVRREGRSTASRRRPTNGRSGRR